MPCDRDRSVAGVDLIVRQKQMLFQRRSISHDLKNRTRRVHPLDRFVSDVLRGGTVDRVWVECRIIRKSEHLTSFWIHHDRHSGFCLCRFDSILKRLLGDVLKTGSGGENNIAGGFALDSRLVITAPEPIALLDLLYDGTVQFRILRQFDARASVIVGIAKTDDLRCHTLIWIAPLLIISPVDRKSTRLNS